ncbi:MAG: TIGR01244 family sulfur transferase [Woeseiaceae bacterium]|nr:TIGR01244 family sulfur transferase [Woeseiaceae bacterium]
MDIRPLSADYAVSPQLGVDDIVRAKDDGFRVIINNRPDGEEPGQPAAADLATAARDCGLDWHDVPIGPAGITAESLATFRDALAASDGPALAFCKSGMRSAAIWAFALAPHADIDALLTKTREAGYDLGGLRPGLEAAARHFQPSSS